MKRWLTTAVLATGLFLVAGSNSAEAHRFYRGHCGYRIAVTACYAPTTCYAPPVYPICAPVYRSCAPTYTCGYSSYYPNYWTGYAPAYIPVTSYYSPTYPCYGASYGYTSYYGYGW